ncbi:hypothetical protein EUGRSUZ_E01579 [Eucalyptus grandis]|uniref:Uncharacterized protein n=2 Tax=Eucalyptus grandis TaxID=71139 RepID=A0ACC3KUS5_EUCGR|nr:hypothetical protein EUGRSUZ_E01579 [Eucalyptus grandis]
MAGDRFAPPLFLPVAPLLSSSLVSSQTCVYSSAELQQFEKIAVLPLMTSSFSSILFKKSVKGLFGGFVRARRLLFVLSLSRRLSLLSGASHSADSPATPYSADSPAPPHSTDSPAPTGGAPSPAEASESRLVKLVARAFYDDFTTKGENQPKSRRSDNHGIVRSGNHLKKPTLLNAKSMSLFPALTRLLWTLMLKSHDVLEITLGLLREFLCHLQC